MASARPLSQTFRSIKRPNPNPNPLKSSATPSSSLSSSLSPSKGGKSQAIATPKSRAWSVYLIISTNLPIKTYVGVTTDFPRRLKQHNGELKGGAKASRAGRPWVCACIIQGFKDHSEACEFESKWKSFSRKLPRKKKNDEIEKEVTNGSLLLLQHRKAAVDRVKGSLESSHLDFDWQLNP